MRSGLLFLVIAVVLAQVDAQEPLPQTSGKKSIQVFVTTNEQGNAITTFSADVSTIYAIWKGESLAAGDRIKAIWIAEDIGDAGPKESKILEAAATVYKSNEHGAFSLSRPTGKNWPVGKYTVAIYINGSLAQRAKFRINQGVQIETH